MLATTAYDIPKIDEKKKNCLIQFETLFIEPLVYVYIN